MQALEVSRRGNADCPRPHNTARGLQVMHAIAGFPAGDRAGRMHRCTEGTRLFQIAEGQLAGMDTDAFRLMHGTRRFLVIDIFALDRLGIENARVILEHIAQQLGFFSRIGITFGRCAM